VYADIKNKAIPVTGCGQIYRPPLPGTGITLLFFLCVVFVVCNVSFIVCEALCAVLFERDVLFCNIYVLTIHDTDEERGQLLSRSMFQWVHHIAAATGEEITRSFCGFWLF
jgi:hypothetical protein